VIKRAIALVMSTALGIAIGYAAAPIAAYGMVSWTASDWNRAFFFFLVDNSMACNCTHEPPPERIQTLHRDLSTLEMWRKKDPGNLMVAQSIGLGEVRLAKVQQEMGNESEAGAQMKAGQEELRKLCWKDLSEEHLVALTTQLDSEYGPGSGEAKPKR
jgi:hypothetical protein